LKEVIFMGVQKPAPLSEQIAFETSFLKLLLNLINHSAGLEQLGDFIRLRDLIYSPGEYGHAAITQAVIRRRSGEFFNSFQIPSIPPAAPAAGGQQ
jgi:hypothetical protein